MVRVFIALLAGIMCQSICETDLFYILNANVGYEVYRVTCALAYAVTGYAAIYLAYQELKIERNFQACIISLLCLCMIITSWFDLTMAYEPFYELLNYYRTQAEYSWIVIYRAVELMTLLIVFIYVTLDFIGRVSGGRDRIASDNFNRRYRYKGQQ